MSPLTIPAVSKQLDDFYVPRFEIRVGGNAIDPRGLRDVIQVTYNDSTTEIDSFDITVNNWDAKNRTFKYSGSEEYPTPSTGRQAPNPLHKIFEPCANEFELKLGYGASANLSTMAKGATTSLEPSFPSSGGSTLTVRALNVLFKLRRNKHSGNWKNKRISDVALDIGKRNNRDGSKRFPLAVRIDRNAKQKEPILDYVAQENQYDIDFLLLEARKLDYVVYVGKEPAKEKEGEEQSEYLYFGPSNTSHPGRPDVTYELKWGISLIDFTPKLTTANQVESVEVRSWNRQTNQKIRKKAKISDRLGINDDLLPLLDPRGCKPREEVVVKEPQFTPEQAQRRARALLTERLKQMVQATGTTIGLPDLRAGQRVRIVGLGARFAGIYFVTKTTHTINDSGYLTRFTAHRERGLQK